MQQTQTINTILDSIVTFISAIFAKTGKQKAVIAVSGGIDSAVSVTATVRALGSQNVFPVLLPYGEQDMTDAKEVLRFNGIDESQWHEINIKEVVDTIAAIRQASSDDIRLGNIMARTRMIMVFDIAKQLDALVCGTENKSEKYLAYFTRFGDEASDLEPLQDIYKTQIRELAAFLQIPQSIQTKAPSAGLWQDQTDETELGFTYEEADRVLGHYIDGGVEDIQKITQATGISQATVERVIARVKSQHFKHEVPYTFTIEGMLE